ncbi:MAG: isoprenylcysteine carboxylmethyltransferase family protein [Pseudomonadota bacterium]
MTPALLFIGFLIAQRLVELWIAQRNTHRLLARGAQEHAPDHYKLIVAVHALWIFAIVVFGFDQAISWAWLAIYAGLQLFRLWILMSLGERWTTKIIILDEPLVAKGPYQYIKHPNYVLVIAEIIAAPMVLGLTWVAIVFTILNALVLAIRIPAENRALATITQR